MSSAAAITRSLCYLCGAEFMFPSGSLGGLAQCPSCHKEIRIVPLPKRLARKIQRQHEPPRPPLSMLIKAGALVVVLQMVWLLAANWTALTEPAAAPRPVYTGTGDVFDAIAWEETQRLARKNPVAIDDFFAGADEILAQRDRAERAQELRETSKITIQSGSCCDKARGAGRACAHKCCVSARANALVCEKCNRAR